MEKKAMESLIHVLQVSGDGTIPTCERSVPA